MAWLLKEEWYEVVGQGAPLAARDTFTISYFHALAALEDLLLTALLRLQMNKTSTATNDPSANNRRGLFMQNAPNMSSDSDFVFDQVMACARRAARGGFDVMSTSEKLTAAVLLNRGDWLVEMHYTLADTIRRIGPTWLACIPEAQEHLEIEGVNSRMQSAQDMDAVIHCVRRALGGEMKVMSTSQRLTAALLLNRADWLAEMNYSISGAIHRIGPDWSACIPRVKELLEGNGTIHLEGLV